MMTSGSTTMVTGSYSTTQRSAGTKADVARSRSVRHSAKNNLWDSLVRATINLSLIEQHDLVLKGISMTQLKEIIDCFTHLTEEDILPLLGIDKRAVETRKTEVFRSEPLGVLLDLIAMVQRAADVFGDREAAETWMRQRAVAFDGQRPVELLSTRPGAMLVKNHLTRVEYGVYV